MEHDDTYEIKRTTDEDIFAIRRKNNRLNLEEQIQRQLRQKKRAEAVLMLEKALAHTVKQQVLNSTFDIYAKTKTPFYERDNDSTSEMSSFTEFSEDKLPVLPPGIDVKSKKGDQSDVKSFEGEK
jgi:hypothetical protein